MTHPSVNSIVERLREPCDGWSGDAWAVGADVAEEGAAEIERLRRVLSASDSNHRSMAKLLAEIGERARAAESQLERVRAEAWQPIETAPKDGTPFIGAFFGIRWADSHRRNDIVRCWYQPEFDAFISACREMTLARGYTFESGATRELHSPVVEPVTHWMPLPAPPQQKTEQTRSLKDGSR